MKKYVSLLLAALTLAAAVPPSGAALADSGLNLSCASCVLMEKETGTILLEENSHERLEPASVTKIMTLLLVMEASPWRTRSLSRPTPPAWAAPRSTWRRASRCPCPKCSSASPWSRATTAR